jgi:hypothetical protein
MLKHGNGYLVQMVERRIAVLIADSYGEPFETIKAIIQPQLWESLPDVDVFYMRGTEPNSVQNKLNTFTDKVRYKKYWPIQRFFDQIQISHIAKKNYEVERRHKDLFINLPEGLRYLGLKLIKSLNYLYIENYDVVYKTTLSSLVNPRNFKKITAEIDLSVPFYGGTPINFGVRPFVSGANLMINRKTIEIILNSLHKWNHGLLDDVAIGRVLEGHANIKPILSLNFSSVSEVLSIPNSEIQSAMHFRCKSSKLKRDDVEIMKKVIKRINNEA